MVLPAMGTRTMHRVVPTAQESCAKWTDAREKRLGVQFIASYTLVKENVTSRIATSLLKVEQGSASVMAEEEDVQSTVAARLQGTSFFVLHMEEVKGARLLPAID